MSVCIVTSGFQMLYVPPPGPPLNLTATIGNSAGLPGTPPNVLIVNQGGASNTLTNSQGLAWGAAAPGANPVAFYRVYDNGVKVSTDGAVTATTFTHSSATNSNFPTLDQAASPHYYQVSAVDTQGNEGARSTQLTLYAYQGTNGGSQWGARDFSFGMVAQNYTDTTGAPVGGGVDMALTYPGGGNHGGWQPYSGTPQTPTYDLEVGGFTSGGGGFVQMDVKPTVPGNVLSFGLISRFPFGDIFNYKGPNDISIYGPLVVGQWNTLKMPLGDFSIGTSSFIASIGAPYGSDASGPWATMIVTSFTSGVGVDYGGFVTSGAPAGTRIGIQGVTGNNSSVASWQVQGPGITGSTVIASQPMTSQRTNIYKPSLDNHSGDAGGLICVNNFLFTRL